MDIAMPCALFDEAECFAGHRADMTQKLEIEQGDGKFLLVLTDVVANFCEAKDLLLVKQL